MLNWRATIQALNPRHQAIRQRILQNPYYRFQSLEEIAIAAELEIIIDVQQATVDDWLRLPGISIHQARSLVELIGMGAQLLCIEDLAAAVSLPLSHLRQLKPILSFTYTDPDSLLTPQRINPNTASVEQLSQIPLLNPEQAEWIICDRNQQGNYRNLADFQRRLGIDGEQITQLMYYLKFV